MSLEESVRFFACIHCFTIGFSHVFAHETWVEFFVSLRDRGRLGVFVVGFLSLGFGSIVVSFHPVWHGLPIVLTLFGWTQVVKGFVYLCAPSFGLQRLMAVRADRSHIFIQPGFFLIGLGALMLVTLVF